MAVNLNKYSDSKSVMLLKNEVNSIHLNVLFILLNFISTSTFGHCENLIKILMNMYFQSHFKIDIK